MKTRTLLLLSVGCGLVILLAGGFKLLQVATEHTRVPVLGLGESARIGDMTVVVISVTDRDDGTGVVVQMSGVAGEPVVDDWRLLGDGHVYEASGANDSVGPVETMNAGPMVCGGSTTVPDAGEIVECVLRFPAVESVQAVAYTRAGEQRQWAP